MHSSKLYPVSTLCLAVILLASPGSVQLNASEATMLPEGVYRARLYSTSASADSMFGADGTERPFPQIYDAALNSNSVAPDGGAAYSIDTGGSFSLQRYDIYLEYGITEHFGLGAWLHHLDIDNKASARLTTGPDWGSLTGVQQAGISGAASLVDGLDASASAAGDSIVGIKHRLYGDNKSRHRFAYHAGIRLPTGHVADPRDSSELSTGDGQYDIGIWLSYDLQPVPEFFINFQTRHEYQFRGQRRTIDPNDPGSTLRTRFQPGFINYAEIEAWYYHAMGDTDLVLKLLTTYYDEAEERQQTYNAGSGSYTGPLSTVADSDTSAWSLQPAIGVTLFRHGIPIRAFLSLSKTLSGVNTPAAEFVQFRIDVFF